MTLRVQREGWFAEEALRIHLHRKRKGDAGRGGCGGWIGITTDADEGRDQDGNERGRPEQKGTSSIKWLVCEAAEAARGVPICRPHASLAGVFTAELLEKPRVISRFCGASRGANRR